MPLAPNPGDVWSPPGCRCGGKLPDECGLSFCRPQSRLEKIAAEAGVDADELRGRIYLEITKRGDVHICDEGAA